MEVAADEQALACVLCGRFAYNGVAVVVCSDVEW